MTLFQKHTLPVQLSAILPLEELIFPPIAMFTDSPHNESDKPDIFYLRRSETNLVGLPTTTTLNCRLHCSCRVEQETSATPRIVNQRSFLCPSEDVGLSFEQWRPITRACVGRGGSDGGRWKAP